MNVQSHFIGFLLGQNSGRDSSEREIAVGDYAGRNDQTVLSSGER